MTSYQKLMTFVLEELKKIEDQAADTILNNNLEPERYAKYRERRNVSIELQEKLRKLGDNDGC